MPHACPKPSGLCLPSRWNEISLAYEPWVTWSVLPWLSVHWGHTPTFLHPSSILASSLLCRFMESFPTPEFWGPATSPFLEALFSLLLLSPPVGKALHPQHGLWWSCLESFLRGPVSHKIAQAPPHTHSIIFSVCSWVTTVPLIQVTETSKGGNCLYSVLLYIS